MQLSDEEKGILLLAARDSISSLFFETSKPTIDFKYYPQLQQKNAGAFVTINANNTLRGCIGYLTSNLTIFETVCDAAKQAATNDNRFPPVREEELSHLNIEISVLSPMFSLNSYEEIRIGQHGLLIEEGAFRGVLLPQVATENNYNTAQFLSALCVKAGLPANEWEKKNLSLKAFTAIVFSEIGRRKRTYERY